MQPGLQSYSYPSLVRRIVKIAFLAFPRAARDAPNGAIGLATIACSQCWRSGRAFADANTRGREGEVLRQAFRTS